jgi:acyl-CoA dehydrogenase
MRRDVFTPEHEMFREQFRRFAAREIEPKIARWNRERTTDRDTWRRMGEEGFLGPALPTEYGGGGGDFLYDAIVMEELGYLRAHGLMTAVHSSICLPYIASYGSEEQKRRYLPPAIRGELLVGICMTEPGTGSDLAAVQTRAVRTGDHYVLNGAKTFISLGQLGGLFIVVAKTDPDARPPHRGISLLLVEADTPGFVRGRKLEKLGLPAQDTSEIFLEDCKVPAASLLGREGEGFRMLMEKLQQERLCIAVGSIASSRRALDDTIIYVKQRHAFGQPIAAFQNTQFTLAELATQIEIGQAFVDKLLAAHARGDEIVSEVSMAKWWTTDLQKRVAAACLQLHGGYGFMLEYPISMDYADAAVQSIYAGSNEIMKTLIAERLGLGRARPPREERRGRP